MFDLIMFHCSMQVKKKILYISFLFKDIFFYLSTGLGMRYRAVTKEVLPSGLRLTQ